MFWLMLIHTFLAQASSPRFSSNQYHKYLSKWHVLEEDDFPNPGRPPYYSSAFFNLIKDVRETTPLNLAWVTVKQWYQLLLERGVTHTAQVMTMMPHQSFSNPNWKITTNSWISQNPTDFQEYLALPQNRRHSYLR